MSSHRSHAPEDGRGHGCCPGAGRLGGGGLGQDVEAGGGRDLAWSDLTRDHHLAWDHRDGGPSPWPHTCPWSAGADQG